MNWENELVGLRDDELLKRLETMASSERLLGRAIVEHLCEVETRGLHLDIGFGSLFEYCIERLGFSRDVAFKRVKVARAAAAHPVILEHLESGELSLSSVVVMAPHLGTLDGTDGDELVEAARGKSKRDVERLLATRLSDEASPRGDELRLQMSERFEELLREARDLEAIHDAATILEKALETFVAARKKQRFALTDRPLQRARETSGDGIPARVRREVYQRDGGICSFVSDTHLGARQCESTYQLEFDHVVPRALGGASTADNLRLLCRKHNQRAAELVLGKESVEAAKRRASLSRAALKSQEDLASSRERASIGNSPGTQALLGEASTFSQLVCWSMSLEHALAPAAAEGAVQLDDGAQLLSVVLDLIELGGQEVLL